MAGLGRARHGWAWRGEARQGLFVVNESSARLGLVRRGKARLGKELFVVNESSVAARQGEARDVYTAARAAPNLHNRLRILSPKSSQGCEEILT